MAGKRGQKSANEGSNPRHQSIKGASQLLGIDRNTIQRWIENEGMPYVQAADKSKGKSWVIDMRQLLQWYAAREAEKALERSGGPVDGDDAAANLEHYRARHEAAKAIKAEIELAEIKDDVIRVSDAAAQVQQEYQEVRQALLQIPSAAAPIMEGISDAAQAKAELERRVNRALQHLQYDQDLADQADQAEDDGDDDADAEAADAGSGE